MTESPTSLLTESGRETRRERFLRLAPRRVDKALIAIRRIGNLAARTYESTEAERQRIIDAIFAEANELKEKLEGKSKQVMPAVILVGYCAIQYLDAHHGREYDHFATRAECVIALKEKLAEEKSIWILRFPLFELHSSVGKWILRHIPLKLIPH
jgi:hypothetical protein